MKITLAAVIAFFFLGFITPVHSLTNDSDYLIIENGETISLSGQVYKTIMIHVKAGGTITIPPYDTNKGYLNLIAPTLIIEGTINGEAAGFNELGKGGTPSDGGGGGAGYGGKGGNGASTDTKVAGSGGPTYNTAYIANTGSYGYNTGYKTQYSGYGGAGIRLDAIDLSLNTNATINANANQTSAPTVGGGSGGCILIDARTIILQSGVQLSACGGPGGAALGSNMAAGGGGGGRIKVHQRSNYNNYGAIFNLIGMPGGGSNAQSGENGLVSIDNQLPLPTKPTLITPLNTQEVGVRPTLKFSTNDASKCKFLIYQIIIAEDDDFNTIFHTSSQKDQDSGWAGKTYFSSDEIASYAMPVDLDAGDVYYWSVSVSADDGQTWVDANSHFMMHTTTASNLRPTVPKITLPANGSINISKLPVFQIAMSDPDADTLTCQLTLSKDPSLSNPRIFDANYPGWDQTGYQPASAYQGVTATCELLSDLVNDDSLLPGTTYYCQATVFDQLQQSSDSEIITFTTVERPEQPIIISPLNNATVTTKEPGLQIYSTSPTNSLLQYVVELSADNFQTKVVYESNTAGSGWLQSSFTSGSIAELKIPPENQLVPGVQYTWRCQAYDVDNQYWSLITGPMTFLVSTPPLLPVLSSPGDNYEAPDSQITFKITAVSEGGNTLTGKVEISDTNFESILHTFDQNTSQAGWDQEFYYSNSVAAFTVPDSIEFKTGQAYQWRATFFDGTSWSDYSEARSFSLASKLLFKEVKTYPNPAVATSRFNIYFNISLDANVSILIYNKLGKEIHRHYYQAQGGLGGNQVSIDISNFSSGLYYYLVRAESSSNDRIISKPFSIIK